MPITTTYPGVYIEEVPSGVRTIVGVATSVAAFIDFFARGPINQAVQVFNTGDFNREFGGLHTNSEASYAIDQFFKNGGTEAWVVRTAEADPADPTKNYETASVVLQDGAGTDVLRASAGRRLKGGPVDDPGEWGNNLRIDVDYDIPPDTVTPPSFNLTLSEVAHQDGRQVIIQTETYRNLNMDDSDANYAVDVVNDGSKLIQLTRLSAAGVTNILPAQTGTIGTAASAAGSDAVANLTSGETFDIAFLNSVDDIPTTVTATVQFAGTLSTLQQVRRVLQAALRAAGASLAPAEPLLTGATVQLINNQFRVLAGRTGSNFDAHKTLIFSDSSGTPATDLGLAGALNNVQQYSVGSTTSAGAQVGGTAGNNGNPPGATDLRGIRDPDKTGMYALEDVDLFNILCIPRAADLAETEMQAVYSEAITYCEERRAFLIIDIPEATNNLEDARDWLEDNSLFRHRNAAAYYPRLKIPDPRNDYRLRSVGASGTIAGLYARTDATRGVWKAPAGIEAALRNVPDLDYRLTDPQNGQLNPLGFNCLRTFDVIGNVCWGARTLVGADQLASEWKYVPVRRIALFIEETLFRGTQWVVFEPNDEPLWAQIRLNVGAFMQNLFRQGAFQGTTPREAYLVKCDSETTTQNDINLGVVNILVGFAPLKPAEFVIIRLQQLAGQVEA